MLHTRANKHLYYFHKYKTRRDVDGRVDDDMSSWITDHMKDKHSNEYENGSDDNIVFSDLSSHRDPFTR